LILVEAKISQPAWQEAKLVPPLAWQQNFTCFIKILAFVDR
jgi:hypothetical protein